MNPKLTVTLLALLLALSGLAAVPAGAVTVGLSDNAFQTLSEPRLDALGVKRVRVVVPWNEALLTGSRRQLDTWVKVAKAEGAELFVSFNTGHGSRCPRRPCVLPSPATFDRAFGAFRLRWPHLRTIGVWNEANHRSQPTFRRPQRAAQYFNIIRKRCRGCTIVAADVIDEPNMVPWLEDFKKKARGERIFGLHNYRDVNPRRGQRYGGTKTLLKAVRGRVWLTETGGIVRFVLPDGRTLFPYSEQRANLAIGKVFRLAREYRRRIDRVYVYHWRQSAPDSRFDAGLVRSTGEPRAGYRTLRRWLDTRWFKP
jgi:hypothetical protein